MLKFKMFIDICILFLNNHCFSTFFFPFLLSKSFVDRSITNIYIYIYDKKARNDASRNVLVWNMQREESAANVTDSGFSSGSIRQNYMAHQNPKAEDVGLWRSNKLSTKKSSLRASWERYEKYRKYGSKHEI